MGYNENTNTNSTGTENQEQQPTAAISRPALPQRQQKVVYHPRQQ